MEEKYRIKLSVLLDSLEYCSDVESDGYYVVQGSNEVIMYGEGLSEEYVGEDELSAYLQSKECLQLPTLHDIDASAPNWNQEITIRYMDEMIEDDKQKKLLRKAHKNKINIGKIQMHKYYAYWLFLIWYPYHKYHIHQRFL